MTDHRAIDRSPQFLAIRNRDGYSGRNTSNGALLTETAQIFSSLAGGTSIEQARQAVFEGSLVSQSSITGRRRIWNSIHYRYLTHRIEWIIASLTEAIGHGSHSPEFISLLYVHYALRDRLTYDFVTEVLWNMGYQNRPLVTRNDVLDMLDARIPDHPEIERWTENSRVKLAGNILSALRDFGVLEGIQKKFLVRPALPPSTAEHVLRILIAEGKRGKEVIDDSTWRLFLLSEQDVARHLGNLASEGEIHFEKVGTTVVLQTPKPWEVAS
jgi:hypothetical protein